MKQEINVMLKSINLLSRQNDPKIMYVTSQIIHWGGIWYIQLEKSFSIFQRAYCEHKIEKFEGAYQRQRRKRARIYISAITNK